MKIEGYEFPDGLFYDRNHFWGRLEDGLVVMGTTEFTTRLAGEITYVSPPEEGDEVIQGRPAGSIESGKWVGRIYAICSGEVAEINERLEDEPEAINEAPYEVWICKIRPAAWKDESANLLQAGGLDEFIKCELERVNA